jgi:hypothetical protein
MVSPIFQPFKLTADNDPPSLSSINNLVLNSTMPVAHQCGCNSARQYENSKQTCASCPDVRAQTCSSPAGTSTSWFVLPVDSIQLNSLILPYAANRPSSSTLPTPAYVKTGSTLVRRWPPASTARPRTLPPATRTVRSPRASPSHNWILRVPTMRAAELPASARPSDPSFALLPFRLAWVDGKDERGGITNKGVVSVGVPGTFECQSKRLT